MNVLYHITKSKYLHRILTEGLKINSNKSGFVTFSREYKKELYSKYKMQPIFLSSDPYLIANNQLTDDFVKSCVVLKINTKGLSLDGEYEYMFVDDKYKKCYRNIDETIEKLSVYFNKSFICKENIDTKRIISYIDYVNFNEPI